MNRATLIRVATVLALTGGAGCAAPEVAPAPPKFAPPRHGVFVAPLPIVESPDDELAPALSPSGARVVYAARSNGNLDIFTRPLAGGAPTRLTSHTADDKDPTFSPDGKRIAWVSQAEDAKGDLWIMDADGGSKHRLTGREGAERAPAFSADGRALYFNELPPGGVLERIERLELGSGVREVVVPVGWDPSPAPGGEVLFYAAPGDDGRPRLFARRLRDGRTVAITDGAYLEGLPHAHATSDGLHVIFCRFVDDQDGDGTADTNDPASLWAVAFDPGLFDGAPLRPAVPLTSGAGGEVFATAHDGWMLFTIGRTTDLDVAALPTTGEISSDAGAEAILQAARAEDDPALRRLALRYLVATASALVGPARYELARELAERGRLADAIDELGRVRTAAAGSELAQLATLEIERLRLVQHLEGRLAAREPPQRAFAEEQASKGAATAAGATGALLWRARGLAAEADYAVGRRSHAIAALETLWREKDVAPEDGARALDRLGDIYAAMGDEQAVARVSRELLTRFSGERHYVRRAAERWVATASAGTVTSPLAALEAVLRAYPDLPPVAARAVLAMAELQAAGGNETAALDGWRRVVADFPDERAGVAEALRRLGAAAERGGDSEQALAAYEKLLADFSDERSLRLEARRGLVRIATRKAIEEERAGELAKARESWQRLLRTDDQLVVAHRRYIALSAALGRLDEVVREYATLAVRSPRDKLARYGHGYALTFVRPLPLDDAEAEIDAALELDSRFAAAHLTKGWLRERKERLDARAGWLEAAEQSYGVAVQLADPAGEPELWAAANLNRGNVLFALGKNDSAFSAYLARELSGAPHDSLLSELLFRESFARLALRQEAYDVALDMSTAALRLSARLSGQPRRGPLLSLLGALNLLVGSHEDARRWYSEAITFYEKKGELARTVPLLRGRAVAEQALGRLEQAVDSTTEILALLAQGHRPPEAPHSIFIAEIPGNPANVTRALYGFGPGQEEELARTIAARVERDRGDLVLARQLDARRLELLHDAARDSVVASRIGLELLLALDESARLAMRAGVPAEAASRLLEALILCRANAWWREAVVLLESLAWVWTTSPVTRLQPAVAAALAAAQAGLHAPDIEPDAARRLARISAIIRFGNASTAVTVEPGASRNALPKVLARLDERATAFSLAAADAALAGDADLATRIGAFVPAGATAEAAAGQSSAPAAKLVLPLGPGPGRGAAPGNVAPWRRELDRALAATGAARDAALLDAIAAFESDPWPAWAPERALLLEAGATLLVARGETERAWRLLERDRLLALAPPTSRLGSDALARECAELRAARATRDYADRAAAASPLARAVLARPVSLAQLSLALDDAAFVQVFAPSARAWHWFVVAGGALTHMVTPPPADGELPIAVAELLGEKGAKASRLVVDAGELLEAPAWSLRTGAETLGARYLVVEAISATWWVAAREQRNLARRGTLAIGGGKPTADLELLPLRDAGAKLDEVGRDRRLVDLGGPTTLQPSPPERPGLAQVVFATGEAKAERLDLDTVAGANLRANVGFAAQLTGGARVARAVAQALILSEVPTAVVGNAGPQAALLRDRLTTGLVARSAAAAFRDLVAFPGGAGLRLFGDAGLDAPARVDFAYEALLRQAKLAASAFKAAQGAPSTGSWRTARGAFSTLLDTVAFLREPASAAALAASSDERKRKLSPSLPALEAVNRANLAKVYLALDEVAESARLQEQVIDFYVAGNKAKEAAQNTLALGRALSYGKRPKEAEAAFLRCVELARKAGDSGLEADCLVRRGSELRTLSDYDDAVRAYQEAIMVYAGSGSPSEVYPRRYLGFVYESSLNNYDKALDQYQAALILARRETMADLVPALLVDIARVSRLRGDYTRAIAQVSEAEAALTETNAQGRAEAAIEAAKIYWYRGNYRRALQRQREGLELARRAGSTFLEIQAASLAGLVALNQGELGRAERSIQEALDLARLTGRKAEEATQLNNLGIVLREASRLPDAVASFRAALAIDEELGSIEGRAYDLRNLAIALDRQGQHQEALDALGTALELSRSIGNRYNELQCVFATAQVQEGMGNAAARASYELAAKQSREASVPEIEWRALYGLGRLTEAAGDAAGARELHERALRVAERLGRGRSDSFAGRGREDLYEDAIRLATAANDLTGAFALVERSRARGILDILATRSIDLPSGSKPYTTAELSSREGVLAAERDLDHGVEGAAAALEQARATHDDAAEALRHAYPRLWRMLVLSPPSLAAVQSVLPRDVTLLEYFVGRHAVSAFVVRADGIHVTRLELGAEALEAVVRRLATGLRAFAPVDAELTKLGDLLLAPVSPAQWAATRTLVVVPHGALHHVPFAALPVGGDALLARVAVAVTPSAALLYDRLSEPRPGPIMTVAAMAPASDLPFATLEARAIAGDNAYLGPDASETALLELDTDAVDVAAHVELDPTDALGSAMVLAADDVNDGRLELRQVFGLASVPRLVTLSACNSALGEGRGDEWVGLSFGFLSAGSHTVVATLTRVSDLAAALVMKRFYRALAHRPPAEALREAALAARRTYPHPAHWASFVLIGDFR